MDMDYSVGIDCGNRVGWAEEGKGAKIEITVIEEQLKNDLKQYWCHMSLPTQTWPCKEDSAFLARL